MICKKFNSLDVKMNTIQIEETTHQENNVEENIKNNILDGKSFIILILILVICSIPDITSFILYFTSQPFIDKYIYVASTVRVIAMITFWISTGILLYILKYFRTINYIIVIIFITIYILTILVWLSTTIAGFVIYNNCLNIEHLKNFCLISYVIEPSFVGTTILIIALFSICRHYISSD